MIACGGGGEGRETGLTPEFRAASETLDEELHRMRGLLHVAHQLGHEIEEVNINSESLTTMIELAERSLEAAEAAKDRAWRSQGGQ